MTRSTLPKVAAAAIVVACLLLLPRALGGPRPGNLPAVMPTGLPDGTVAAVVDKVVDGDTIWVRIGATRAKVRILEIDTPELNIESGSPECGSREAEEFARQELPVGSSVHLMPDREDKDRYGRLLRYVWDAEGELYNQKAVAMGYARTLLIRPNDRYISQLRAAEDEARAARLGIWGSC